MKRLSSITESVWGDIRKRSMNEVIRKEDDVNLLDFDDLVAYIKNNYKFDNTPFDVIPRIYNSNIFIPFCRKNKLEMGGLYFGYYKKVVFIQDIVQEYVPKLWKKLEDNFVTWIDNPDHKDDPKYEDYKIINPKDTSKKVDNSFLFEVLNFIIDNLDDTVTPCVFKRTNESVWGDIRKRSTGDTIRKEDELENIYEILNDLYNPKDESDTIELNSDNVCVPLFKCASCYGNLWIYIKNDYISFSSPDPNKYHQYSVITQHTKNELNELYDKIEGNFSVIEKDESNGSLNNWYVFKIKPNNGEKKIEFVKRFIDFIIDNTHSGNYGIRRIINKK